MFPLEFVIERISHTDIGLSGRFFGSAQNDMLPDNPPRNVSEIRVPKLSSGGSPQADEASAQTGR